MCTAVSCCLKHHYFGRNLDLDYGNAEQIVITPRNYKLNFRFCEAPLQQLSMIGIATVSDGYPLYYEATNEAGLSAAGLNFPGNAVYHKWAKKADNIAPFEFIPWVLSQCRSVEQACALLSKANICTIPFSDAFPLSPLHWIIADKIKSITVEPLAEGLAIRDNPVGVLTNNPPFDYHMHNLVNYLNLTPNEPVNRFSGKLTLHPYSLGMGAIGLPGDFSSASRFIRAAYVKSNITTPDQESDCVGQMFHILSSVAQYDGCVVASRGFEKTRYTCCCNTDKGIFYYNTYENRQINAIAMHEENLDRDELIIYPMLNSQNIHWQAREH